MDFFRNFRIFNLNNDAMLPKGNNRERWSKPLKGNLKINVDAAWNDLMVRLGFVARGSDGFMHWGHAVQRVRGWC